MGAFGTELVRETTLPVFTFLNPLLGNTLAVAYQLDFSI